MTRREFIEEVNTFSELIQFCDDEWLCHCEDVFHEDRLNDVIIEEVGNYDDWQDLYMFLDNIPIGNDWYHWVNGEIEGCDDRFEDYKRPDTACVACRPPAKGALPRVRPVRCRHHRQQLAH